MAVLRDGMIAAAAAPPGALLRQERPVAEPGGRPMLAAMDSLLAFECVGRRWSAAVVAGDGTTLALLTGDDAAAALVPAVHGLLEQHTVGALAVAAGPGSFMGLRLAVGAARSIAYADGLPVHAVDACTALAVGAGSGTWAVLQPLKRDTTFCAVVAVDAAGRARVLRPVRAFLDSDDAGLADGGVVALGPALTEKPDLVRRWLPGAAWGPADPVDAVMVARTARQTPALAWDAVLPRYHQLSGPELLRAGLGAGEGS